MILRRIPSVRRLVLGVLVAVLMAVTCDAVRANDGDDIRHLVQMPVAVDKLHRAGVPNSNLQSMIRTLNRAEVPAADVNLILANVPLFAEDLNSLEAVSNFTTIQSDRGLSGPELASALKKELRSRGIFRSLVPPTDESFLTDRMRKIIETVKRRRLERRRRDEPPEEPAEDPERGQQPPPPGPGGPGPSGRGPGGPSGPGYP